MKLYYFKDPLGNFGDDLNPWLWQRLLPTRFDTDETEIFVGIGTLLNHRLPSEPVKHVFGSGFGYGERPVVDEKFKVHAVRGFHTAGELGFSNDLVITDAAVLIRAVYSLDDRARKFIGFMPTGSTIAIYDWETVCREAGLRFISCHWSVDRVLSELSECHTLVSEAMHGAIVADALRIPWVPVCCSPDVLAFKWKDWLSTMDLPYEPSHVTTLFDARHAYDTPTRMKAFAKRGLSRLGFRKEEWAQLPRTSLSSDRTKAVEELAAAGKRTPYLSDERVIRRHTERYLALLETLR